MFIFWSWNMLYLHPSTVLPLCTIKESNRNLIILLKKYPFPTNLKVYLFSVILLKKIFFSVKIFLSLLDNGKNKRD